MLIVQILFWLAVADLLFIYLGYPLIVRTLARRRPAPVIHGEAAPYSVLIVGHNEAANLPAKIDSLLRSEGAEEFLAEIIVASDGSDDDTAAVLGAIGDPRIRHRAFAERRGKPAVLNELVPQCAAAFVILTDARQPLDPEAPLKLIRRFGDPKLGVVSGELEFRAGTTGAAASGMDVYWRYEKMIRRDEGAWASVPGATGALYAIRKSLFRPIPANSLLDDVAIPLGIILQDYRCTFEEGAYAYDDPSASASQESVRKRRTIAGNLQVLRDYPEVLGTDNPVWFTFLCHKIFRLFSPFLLLLLLFLHALLMDRPPYRLLMAAHLLFYALAGLGWLLRGLNLRSGLLGAPYMFVALNVTTLQAIGDALSGRFEAAWDRSDKIPG